MFSIILTKNNLNNGVFLPLMKFNMRPQTFCFIFCVLINCTYLMGQQAQTQLFAPQKLDSLLQKKIALDRLNYTETVNQKKRTMLDRHRQVIRCDQNIGHRKSAVSGLGTEGMHANTIPFTSQNANGLARKRKNSRETT